MNKYSYVPHGVCSTLMEFEVDDSSCVHNLHVTNGCNGNLQGTSKLVEGRNVDEVIQALEGIKCGFKTTSCPDQLAKALKEYKNSL